MGLAPLIVKGFSKIRWAYSGRRKVSSRVSNGGLEGVDIPLPLNHTRLPSYYHKLLHHRGSRRNLGIVG